MTDTGNQNSETTSVPPTPADDADEDLTLRTDTGEAQEYPRPDNGQPDRVAGRLDQAESPDSRRDDTAGPDVEGQR